MVTLYALYCYAYIHRVISIIQKDDIVEKNILIKRAKQVFKLCDKNTPTQLTSTFNHENEYSCMFITYTKVLSQSGYNPFRSI